VIGRQAHLEIPISPQAHVSIHGHEDDTDKKETQVIKENGFDPVWDETMEFQISHPDVAILVFQVYDNYCKAILVMGAYPVRMLREGIRWVPMWDYMLRSMDHCGLLVEIRFPETPTRGQTSGKSSVAEMQGTNKTRQMDLLARQSMTHAQSAGSTDMHEDMQEVSSRMSHEDYVCAEREASHDFFVCAEREPPHDQKIHRCSL
jgi:hypothetical protein